MVRHRRARRQASRDYSSSGILRSIQTSRRRCDAVHLERGDISRDRLLADYFLQLGRGQILRFSDSHILRFSPSLTGKGLSAPAGNGHRVQHLASRIS